MQKLLKIFDEIDREVIDAISTLVDKNIIEYDEENNRIIFNTDMVLKFRGNVEIDCDKHVIIKSGLIEDERINHPYSIWLNPEFDEKGNPVPEYDIEMDKVEHLCQE